ncbi:MAG: FkbM family methyltransferase [Ruminococcaceae bacterium]|nr:FkbM family methyltransferase [Oscillospiraceae bacterium]
MFANYSIWDKLRESNKPIFLYGTGNGGDKIISALERSGASLTGVFASDGFVRDRYFHGFKVRSYSDVVADYGDDIIVLLAFGTTLESVIAFIRELDSRHELIIPDVPLYGGDVFDFEYFASHRDILEKTLSLLADEKSKQIFEDAVNFRLTGKLEYLNITDDWQKSLTELLGGQIINTALDGGAFKGDSTQEFLDALEMQKIYAVEADPKTFVKLSDFAKSVESADVIPIHAALWHEDGELEYISSGSRGSGESGANKRAKQTTIPCRTIDSIVGKESIDLIKLDVEGAEQFAIDGAVNTIERCQPNMIVSLYHKTDDLFEFVNRIAKLLPDHKLYLRRIPCIPFWDLNLYAVRT